MCLAAPSPAQDGNSLYSINADTVRTDSDNSVTTYQGNARAEVLNLAIEADTISIFGGGTLPSKIEASGSPLTFHRESPNGELSGTAHKIIFLVPDLNLTLIDYVITDPHGNKMKGKKATFALKSS